jgi:anti-sigma B factor antagonist
MIGGGRQGAYRRLEKTIFATDFRGSHVAMATPRRLETNESAAITVVRFKDQKIIDPEAIQELGQELFDLIDKEDRRKLVLNFSRVEFLSSAALGKLITFEKKAKRAGAELILTDISPEIFPVFAITNLDKLFQIKDREADALAVL